VLFSQSRFQALLIYENATVAFIWLPNRAYIFL